MHQYAHFTQKRFLQFKLFFFEFQKVPGVHCDNKTKQAKPGTNEFSQIVTKTYTHIDEHFSKRIMSRRCVQI